MAVAFALTKGFLSNSIGQDPAKWMWRNVHVNEYPSTPWSNTPLRLLFHREVPSPGNVNTPNVSKASIKRASETMRWIGTNTGNFKMLISMSKNPAEEVNQYSLDTGNGGNIF